MHGIPSPSQHTGIRCCPALGGSLGERYALRLLGLLAGGGLRLQLLEF